MALTGKLESEKEINAPAKKFFHCLIDLPNLFHKAVVHESHRTKVLEGDGKSLGSAVHFNYALDGKTVSNTAARIEALDEGKNLITFGCYDGDVMKHYKVLKVHFQVIPRHHKSSVKWSIEYEKVKESVPEPFDYMDFEEKMLEGIDSLALES
ncbi:PREDICTED: MLP-like protein 34 [Nelumbo nucifera]|uniref:MLP-like protein 34 n=2 Tax=Nelumbo nucifera TaxID=4432 RepID=A0A1U8B189_NELNU|nr:PREDICTED: MLP-like protein 34 [Nelumbo nucifera]DAD39533.1 TPA_asm: hypothetical protein HUJ06_013856 [Nelumbo nucifera]